MACQNMPLQGGTGSLKEVLPSFRVSERKNPRFVKYLAGQYRLQMPSSNGEEMFRYFDNLRLETKKTRDHVKQSISISARCPVS